MRTLRLLLIFSVLLLPYVNFAQERYTLSGVVKDAQTSETLIGAAIYVKETGSGITTNEYGYYALNLPSGSYTLQISYIGYENQNILVSISGNTKQNIELKTAEQTLNEVVVTGESTTANIRKPEMSTVRLTTAQIKKMPVVLGEVDVLKSILQLPGVTSAGEGASGFNVRGGAADQNLILLDEATVYNSSHLFGFFSVFNSDAIKDMKLYKGGIPARYGGRVSSVLDIYQKEGNANKHQFSGGIGVVSSRLLAEGPIAKEKATYLLAGRASYAHLFLKLADNPNQAYFYDLNTKINYRFSESDQLFFSGYFGRDIFNLNEKFENAYGNTVLNLRWNHLYSDKLFSNLSMIYSDYYYGLKLDFVGFVWDSGIINYNLKYDFKHYLSDDFRLFYGLNAIYYDFNPGKIKPSSDRSTITERQLDKKYAFEPALYLEAEQSIGKNVTVNYGLRYSQFYRLGQQELNVYQNNQAVVFNPEFQIYEKAAPTGTRFYKKNEKIAGFGYWEPRFSMAVEIDPDQSIKTSYNRTVQYLHLISNTNAPTPLDVWAPSDHFLKPQIQDQYALGYFRNFKNGDYTLETEVFYKNLQNRVDYIDGANLIANEAIEQVVLPGKGRAYGWEVLLKKNTGNLNGWIAYTLSRSEQQTPGRNDQETGINQGQWYKSAYDKLHNLVVNASYNYSDRWTFSALFTLQSGRPTTFPDGQYEYQDIRIPNYGLRNEKRLPAYHHLDLSANYSPASNKNKRWKSEWVFGIYNLYNRKNAASISFRQNEDTARNEAVRFSIFGIVPSVTYNFKF